MKRSRFVSQKAQSTTCSDHFLKIREYVFENGNEVLSNEVVQAGSSYILDFGHSVDYSQTIAVTSPANSPATPSVSALSSEAFGGSVSGLDPFSVSEEAAQQPNP